MATTHLSERLMAALGTINQLYSFVSDSFYTKQVGTPEVCDFAFGNPHEMPLQGFVEALGHWHVPQNKDWYAYKNNEESARATVVASLRERRGMAFESQDVFMTNGAFGALATVLCALLNPGDEVIFLSPPWFFYEGLILTYGGRPVRVRVNPVNFDLDLAAIEAAITPRTKAILINSPNNPTGKIYPQQTLQQLAQLLTEASERHGKNIYLISDEAYSQIIFDGRSYHSPVACYPNSLLLYTYGKTLLTPGQRIGYIALPPSMPDREQLRPMLFMAQLMVGYAFPNALMQYALPELEQLSIDIAHLQHKRDWLVGALQSQGYDVHMPEGTFYLLPRSPLSDDLAFAKILAEQNILCLPGTIVESPGYFRLSLTANDEMIKRSLAGFAAARRL